MTQVAGPRVSVGVIGLKKRAGRTGRRMTSGSTFDVHCPMYAYHYCVLANRIIPASFRGTSGGDVELGKNC